MTPTLFLLVGLPGSGKTTLARRLEADHAALRLISDEWMVPLLGAGDVGGKRDVPERQLLWSVAARALALGVDVVLDFGFWSRSEREEYRVRGRHWAPSWNCLCSTFRPRNDSGGWRPATAPFHRTPSPSRGPSWRSGRAGPSRADRPVSLSLTLLKGALSCGTSGRGNNWS